MELLKKKQPKKKKALCSTCTFLFIILLGLTFVLVYSANFLRFDTIGINDMKKHNFDLRKDLFHKPSLRKIFHNKQAMKEKKIVEILRISGIDDGAASSISGSKLKLSTKTPSVGGKPHFEGMLTIKNYKGQQIKQMMIHLSTPGTDAHWYITVNDIIKYDKNGNNKTPIVAFTVPEIRDSVPWKKERISWNVHDSSTNGWKMYDTLKLTPIKTTAVHSEYQKLRTKVYEIEHDLKHLLLT